VATSLPEILSCAVAVPLIAAGMISDVRSRRISNRLNLLVACAGLATMLAVRGPGGLLWSAGGLGAGLAVSFVIYAVGAIGAGDAKFIGALGAWLGPGGVLVALAAGTVLAGLVAVVEIIRSQDRAAYLANLSLLAGKVASGRLFDPEAASHAALNEGRASLPYGAFPGGVALILLGLRAGGLEW